MFEQNLTRAIIDGVNATGKAFVQRSHAGMVKVRGAYMHLGTNGSPDVIGFMRDGTGRFVGIEVKLPDEKPNVDQRDWQRNMRDAKCVHGIAHSVQEAVDIVFANSDGVRCGKGKAR